MNRSKKKRRIRLSSRDLDILRFLEHERGVTVEVLHRKFFAGQKRDAVKSTLRRLQGKDTGRKLIESEPLDDQRVYYRDTREGARVVGAPPSVADPLGPIAKIRIYAETWYLYVQRPGKRTRLVLRDCREEFRLIGDRFPRHAFYLDETRKKPRLGFILVDHRASVHRTVTKTVDALDRILRSGSFNSFIRQNSFVATVLTSTPSIKRAIDAALRTAVVNRLSGQLLRIVGTPGDGLPIKFDVSVVPGLLPLLPIDRPSGQKGAD